ncbi:MAG: DUF4091 domain-containing protein [Candidatus Glassbacteria bacterium]|nr:DUF4091 domain-containing protein [Candidatus Glassbacteria bacterium]
MRKYRRSVRRLLARMPLAVISTLVLTTATGALGQRVWVCGEAEKVNPLTGSLVSSGSYKNDLNSYELAQRQKNQLWNDTTRTLTLAGAGGELLGFQVIVERDGLELTGVSLAATDLTGPGGATIRNSKFEFFLEYYILKDGYRYPDPLIPLKLVPGYDNFSIPDNEKLGFANNNQAVWVDLLVPRFTAAGLYTGKLVVLSDQGGAFEISVRLQVYGFTLPDECNYDYEFNHYGGLRNNWPGTYSLGEETFLEFERNAYRLCHKNRVRLNVVPYSQSGNPCTFITSSMRPVLADSADNIHVADWSAWDSRFGGYLSGRAFDGLPRADTPVAHWMLPFCHRFSSEFNEQWHGKVDQYPYWGSMPVYEVENMRIMAEFEQHLNERGWTAPLYHVFYNEKGRGKYNNQLPWYLDEPVQQEDFEALRYYSEIFHNGFSNTVRYPEDLGDDDLELEGFPHPGAARFVFRADIGRQTLLSGYLDGFIDLWNIGGAADEGRYNFAEVAARRDKGEHLMFYGPWSYGLDEYNLNLLWSGWNDWRRGSTGHELWNTIGWTSGMTSNWSDVVNEYYKGRTTYLYPGYRLGLNTPLPTTRMKVIRRGVQDWEYLYRLSQLTGTQESADELVAGLMGEGDRSYGRDVDDFGLSEASFALARARVAGLIVAAGGQPPAAVPGDYNGDGKLTISDVIMLIRLMRQTPNDPDLDFDKDGRTSITDAVALILHILKNRL